LFLVDDVVTSDVIGEIHFNQSSFVKWIPSMTFKFCISVFDSKILEMEVMTSLIREIALFIHIFGYI